MHPWIAQKMAAEHHADLLREARAHSSARKAGAARPLHTLVEGTRARIGSALVDVGQWVGGFDISRVDLHPPTPPLT